MPIDFERIDHVMICIPEGTEEKARWFYSEILGLNELTDLGHPLPAGAIWYQIGNIQLHIRPEEPHFQSKRHPAFIVSDLEAARKHLELNQVSIKNEREMPGKKRFSFLDPFGNSIELIQVLT